MLKGSERRIEIGTFEKVLGLKGFVFNTEDTAEILEDSPIYILYEGQKILGYIAVNDNGPSQDILFIDILESRRSEGLGKYLISRVIDRNRPVRLCAYSESAYAFFKRLNAEGVIPQMEVIG